MEVFSYADHPLINLVYPYADVWFFPFWGVWAINRIHLFLFPAVVNTDIYSDGPARKQA